MTAELIQQIDDNIKNAQKIADLGDALARLRYHKDFKTVVIDGYFAAEAIRLVHLKAAPDMQTPERQQSIINQINAIGAFSEYLSVVDTQANHARKAILADEEAREEILAEGDA